MLFCGSLRLFVATAFLKPLEPAFLTNGIGEKCTRPGGRADKRAEPLARGQQTVDALVGASPDKASLCRPVGRIPHRAVRNPG